MTRVLPAIAACRSLCGCRRPGRRDCGDPARAGAPGRPPAPRLHSLLASQRGTVIFERYFNGRRATTPANIKSVSKSVIAALIGIAADRKLLSLKDPIGKYFPDLTDAAKRAITVEDLLTMRSGLDSTSSRNYGAWVQSPNWVRHALAKPLLAAPGTQMIYSTGNATSCRRSSRKPSGKNTWQFAQECWRSRWASRSLRGCAIRRASTLAATRW